MSEELIEAEAIEEPGPPHGGHRPEAEARPLPVPAPARALAEAIPNEMMPAAVAAAGGVVAGAVTIAAARAATSPSRRRRGRRGVFGRRRDRVVASRSFRVDVHVLDR